MDISNQHVPIDTTLASQGLHRTTGELRLWYFVEQKKRGPSSANSRAPTHCVGWLVRVVSVVGVASQKQRSASPHRFFVCNLQRVAGLVGQFRPVKWDGSHGSSRNQA